MTIKQGYYPMCDVRAEAGHLQVIFHDDDETPVDFVIELLHSVFNKPVADAINCTETVDKHGVAICGIYPPGVASELLEAARQRIRDSGYPLRITTEAGAENNEMLSCRWKPCGAPSSKKRLSMKGMQTPVCADCASAGARNLPELPRTAAFDYT